MAVGGSVSCFCLGIYVTWFVLFCCFFFFSSRRRHTRSLCDWSSDVCSSDLVHEVNFDLLPLEDVDHVDVTYGPSVLLGRNSLGAAVNLVTRRGTVPAEREVEVSGGSFGRYELKARAGDRRGMWDYYVGTRYEHEDGWRAATPSRTATLFGKRGVT